MLTAPVEIVADMDAVILHAEGDEILAEGLSARLAPAETFNASLRADAGLTFGEKLAIFVIWSAKAAADGLGAALTRVADRAQDRCVVVRVDGTPLPPLTAAVQVIVGGSTVSDFASALRSARARANPEPVVAPRTLQMQIGGWTPGVGIGLAIYAGMFVAAGAWRSEEITQAVENGQAVPLATALHSFQTAVADASLRTVQIAQAPSTPSASFVQPQRVVLTAALDTSSIPMIAAEPDDAAPVVVKDYKPAPIRLHPIDTSYVAPAPSNAIHFNAQDVVELIPLDVGVNDAF